MNLSAPVSAEEIGGAVEETPVPALAPSWEPARVGDFKLDFGLDSPSFEFEVSRRAGEQENKAKFYPNASRKLFLGFTYRNLSLGYGFSLPVSRAEREARGDTRSNDLQLRLLGEHSFELAFQEYAGYYVADPEKMDVTAPVPSPQILKPDVRSRNLSFFYVRNLDPAAYSMTAAFLRTDRQTRSNWGRFAFASVAETAVSGDGPFIPAATAAAFGDLGRVQDVRFRSVGGGFGLSGVYVTGRWFASGMLGLGPSVRRMRVQFQGSEDRAVTGVGLMFATRMALGYHGDRHVFGMQGIVDSVDQAFAEGIIGHTKRDARLFYSYRFGEVSLPWLDPVADWVD